MIFIWIEMCKSQDTLIRIYNSWKFRPEHFHTEQNQYPLVPIFLSLLKYRENVVRWNRYKEQLAMRNEQYANAEIY